jgi:hypothetical protein
MSRVYSLIFTPQRVRLLCSSSVLSVLIASAQSERELLLKDLRRCRLTKEQEIEITIAKIHSELRYEHRFFFSLSFSFGGFL